MKYMGSKRRIAKYIAPIIQGFIESAQAKTYIEPFVGGANIIEHIKCDRRIGTDSHRFLIALLTAIQSGWEPPMTMTEQEYNHIRTVPEQFKPELVGFAGFPCSYAAKWFGGYCRGFTSKGVARDYVGEAYRNVMKQAPKLKSVNFYCDNYRDTVRHKNAVIYCDPPYQGTTSYKDKFNHIEFWKWCQMMAVDNTVLVSEYVAPSFCSKLLWSKEITSSLTKNTGSKKGIEKLFLVTL